MLKVIMLNVVMLSVVGQAPGPASNAKLKYLTVTNALD